MRKTVAAALLISICTALVSCGPQAAPGTQAQDGASSDTAVTAATAVEGDTASSAAQAGETAPAAGREEGTSAAAAAQKEPRMVTIVIPSQYADISTQEEADEICKKNGYTLVRTENDGSVTIVMTGEAHEKLVADYEKSVEQGLKELREAEEYPGIVDVTHSDDYSVFTVTIDGDSVSRTERLCADELVMYGTLYQVYTAGDKDTISVEFVGKESGETIETAESGVPGAHQEDSGSEEEE